MSTAIGQELLDQLIADLGLTDISAGLQSALAVSFGQMYEAGAGFFSNNQLAAVLWAVPGSKASLEAAGITDFASVGPAIQTAKDNAGTDDPDEPVDPGVPGETYTLTTGTDNLVGTADNDTFIAGEFEGNTTFTVGDSIDGGAGTDTLRWIQTAAITALPVGASLTSVEILDVISGDAITLDTTSSNITGMTKLTTANQAAQTLTASATQDVDATVTGQVANTVSVTGGKNVKVTTTGSDAGNIAVTGAAGTVTTSMGDAYAAADDTMGTTTITGGTVINASSTVEFTAAQLAQAKVDTGAGIDSVTQGAVSVTGTSSTTQVTVTQTKAQAEVSYVAAVVGTNVKVDGQDGIVNGHVDIFDANRASTTEAGTITTVTANSFGILTVESGALETINLMGTGTSVDADTLGALTTPANTALALNLDGLRTTGAVVIDTDIKTLNITSSNNASTIADLDSDGATTVNVAGNAKVTFTDNNLAAVKDIVVTNTAGAVFGTQALATTVNFTGGAGDDSIILSNAFEKAITMGAGNDTVVYGGAASTTAGKLGSVDAGTGDDTIVMTEAQAANDAASADGVFNASFTGFEVLSLNTVTGSKTVDLDGINGISKVKTTAATALVLDNMASDGTLTLTAATNTVTVNVKSALASDADKLNIVLENGTAATIAYGTVTAANVETINISTVDKGTVGTDGINVLSTVDTATLVATGAKSIVVSGDNGLNLTTTGNTKVTNFDASGVVGNGPEDTAALLAVTYASAATVAANSADTVVTIKGGAGNDVLTGNTTKDTITGGAGSDLITGGLGVDTINVGEGRDIIVVNSTAGGTTDSGTAGADSIHGFTMASAITTAADFTGAVIGAGAASAAAIHTLVAANTQGGENMSILAFDATAAGSANQLIAVEANVTAAAGQATGVTYTIKDGIMTLGGDGASAVDTLGEWLTEVAAAASDLGDALAFQFGTDTYAFVENGTADILVKLVGVTGAAAFAEASITTTGVDNTIYFADIV